MSTPSKLSKSYAILGATGATGRELVKFLLDQEDVHLHLYARSAQKLNAQNPKLATHESVTLHIGALSDTSLLASCLKECSVVFSAVATNENIPDNAIAQRTAHSIASALQLLRESDSKWTCPLVIVLSAAPLNEKLCGEMPEFGKWFAFTALKYIYGDLEEAMKYYRNEHSWIPVVQAQPGLLVSGPPRKCKLSVVEEGEQLPITYGDLARGMCVIADERDKWKGRDVGFQLDETMPFPVAGIVKNLVIYLLPGLIYSFFPWVYYLTHRS